MTFTFNQNSWNQVWGLSAIPPDDNRYTRVVCPVLLSTTAVAVMFSIPGAVVDPWRWGGYISREVQSGLIVGGSTNAKIGFSQRIYVNRLQILIFEFVADYSLVFDSAFSGDVNLSAWEYTGAITP
ncbi:MULTISPECIES: hypothetical protein [unclassified Microcoleus]|uniref:hypothetical protein n=1 Tax=unclassified Microcoleus TaxID=2642155 RepID=UPI002FCEEAEC